MNECEFCHSKFRNRYSLREHQKNAKYCLKIRGKENDYKCEVCDVELLGKRNYLNHISTCLTIEKYKALKVQISELKIQISELQKKPTTVNFINNLQHLDGDWLTEQADLITEEDFEQGIHGLAKFAINNSLKNRVVCTDISRKSLKYKELSGKIVRDPKGKNIAKMFFNSIESKADDFLPGIIERVDIELRNSQHSEYVVNMILEKMKEINEVSCGIKQITKGQEHELKEKFTKQLCDLLPNP
jgi:hypothetical protein